MPNILKNIHNYLSKKNKTISTAESCSGGLLSFMLTQLPGSSKYFILGVTSYSNTAKKNILKIPAKVISRNGAVSKKVATLMAENVRKIAGTDIGVGITGIAGPSGGLTQKPVGTVFIALSTRNTTICKKFIFKGSRTAIREQSALKALQLLKTV